MDFEFLTAQKIVFGRGTLAKLPSLCLPLGERFLIVAGGAVKKTGAVDRLAEGLMREDAECLVYPCAAGEPTVESVDAAIEAGKRDGVDAVIGIGGGSALDTAKAAAAVIPNGGSVRDYLEGVGDRKLVNDPLPFVAVPATAGTGTEVTKNAVVMSRSEQFKKSIRDDRMIARIALVDPELTVSVPSDVTAASGMDAICQLVESYTAKRANDFCDAMALYHTPRAMAALRRAYDDGSDIAARETMSLAAMVSGMCLANAGLGAAHGIGAGLGALLGVRHGIACGMLLPHVMRYNFEHGCFKYAALGRSITGQPLPNDRDAALAAADAVGELCVYLKLPARLSGLGVTPDIVPELAKASMGSSMSKNPVDISLAECETLIRSLI
jgi:alcohol dehydrogenase class IV